MRVIGLVIMVIGMLLTIFSVSPAIQMTGYSTVTDIAAAYSNLYNNLSFIYSSLRWGLIGIMVLVVGGVIWIKAPKK
jgi:hypothetical protein